MTTADRITRFSEELFESAREEGERQHRSARQQLEYWATLGRSVARSTDQARRVQEVFDGARASESLSPDEAIVFNAQMRIRMNELIGQTDFAAPENQQPTPIGNQDVDPDGNVVMTLADGVRVTFPREHPEVTS